MEKRINILTICFLTIFISCNRNKNTFDKENKMKLLGQPTKIEYYKHLEGQAFKLVENPEFIVTDSIEIANITDGIRMANNPEPWKGAGWDRIILTYSDTILKINTNKKKIGFGASGMF